MNIKKCIKFLVKTSDSFIEIIKAIIILFLILIYSNTSLHANIQSRMLLFDKCKCQHQNAEIFQHGNA